MSLRRSSVVDGVSCGKKGSHIRLELSTESGTLKITVPAHKPIKRSTLSKILSSAEMTLDEFLRLL
jgi:predicted RNA binding protein YcfA (HicA-like mRNA interferase family)